MKQNKKLIEFKKQELYEEGQKEKKEFERILKEQIQERERERQKELMYQEIMRKHNMKLSEQIKLREEKLKVDQREILEEGRKIRFNNDAYLKRIEEIRQEKLAYLRGLNINPLYYADLESFKPKI